MEKVQVLSQMNLDEILASIAQLETPDLEKFANQVSHLIALRKAPSLSRQESELLLKINQGLPTSFWQQYNELQEKLQNETMTSKENTKFLELVNQVEEADVERLKNLIDLAQIRNVSLNTLMKDLGLLPPNHV